MSAPVVIVGSGLAGYNLAREFRKLDTQTPLLLITADDGRSYSKPMLSTGFSRNKSAAELCQAEAGQMAEQLQARIWTHTRVEAVDPASRSLQVAGERLVYRDLVLACGAEPRRPPLAGDAAERVLPVNDLEDYARLREAADGCRRILILGAGLVGCELANDLALAGFQVQMVAPCAQLMPGLLPAPLAQALQDALQALGVGICLNAQVQTLQHQAQGYRAGLDNGQSLDCDLVISAVGLAPRTRLATQAGLQVGRAIRVDRWLRTSAPAIHALGDCAEVEGLNLLYVMPLMQCARALAASLAGTPTAVSYGPMPVTLKTPACPLVLATPPAGALGEWRFEGAAPDIRGEFRGAGGELLGYALAGARVADRMVMNRDLPALLPSVVA